MTDYLTALIRLARNRWHPTESDEEGFTTTEVLILLGIFVMAATAFGLWYAGVLSAHEASIK